jgi:hypothetical protein
MNILNEQKNYRSLGSFGRKNKDKNFAKNDVYVTRYITGWNLNIKKLVTTVSGDLHINQRRGV